MSWALIGGQSGPSGSGVEARQEDCGVMIEVGELVTMRAAAYSGDREQSCRAMVRGALSRQLEDSLLRQVFTIGQADGPSLGSCLSLRGAPQVSLNAERRRLRINIFTSPSTMALSQVTNYTSFQHW